MNRTILLILGVLLTSLVLHAAQPPGAPPPPRAIPGSTVADSHPQACVSCHLDMPDIGIDARLSTFMSRPAVEVEPRLLSKAQAVMEGSHVLTGKHPSVGDALESIPSTCIDCHDAAPDAAPRFSQLMHAIHLTGGDENHFLSIFQGECTHCHKMTAGTGRWAVPSGKEQ